LILFSSCTFSSFKERLYSVFTGDEEVNPKKDNLLALSAKISSLGIAAFLTLASAKSLSTSV
jgi:hypothetical protein